MLVEKFAPRREMQLPWLLRWFNFTWALIGNDDDGLFGDDRWRAGREKTLWLAIVWWFRNPFHNLFFYVVGIADRPRAFYSSREWGSPGWTFHAINCTEPWLRWVWLPFISYRSPRVSAYVGWRPYGAFGFKLNRGK